MNFNSNRNSSEFRFKIYSFSNEFSVELQYSEPMALNRRPFYVKFGNNNKCGIFTEYMNNNNI